MATDKESCLPNGCCTPIDDPIFRTPIRNPIVRSRLWFATVVGRSPIWRALNWAAWPIAAPFRLLARFLLARFPALERLEWLFELRSLANRAPFLVSLSAILCVIRGFRVTRFGHIGTDRAIYPLIVLIGSLNPFLAICCATLFGVADFIQKAFFFNDIYGAPDRFSLQFVGAMIGYTIAYSAVIVMGLAPGFASRLARKGIVRVLSRVSAADGASEMAHEPSFAEDAFAIAASTAAAILTMRDAVPNIEMPAFYLRPEADGSCFQVEIGELQATAPYAGLSAAIGTALAPMGAGAQSENNPDDQVPDPLPERPEPDLPEPAESDLKDRGQYPGDIPTLPPVLSDQLEVGEYNVPSSSTTLEHQVGSAGEQGGNIAGLDMTNTGPMSSGGDFEVSNSIGPRTTDEYPAPDVASTGGSVQGDNGAEQDSPFLELTKTANDAVAIGESFDKLSEKGITESLSDIVETPLGKSFEAPGLLDAYSAAVTAADAIAHNEDTTNLGEATDVVGEVGVSWLVGTNPALGLFDAVTNYLADSGIAPDAKDFSPSLALASSVRSAVGLTEGLLTWDPNGMQALQDQNLSGANGKLFQWAAFAGDYLAGQGPDGGLGQAVSNLGYELRSGADAVASIFSSAKPGDELP